MIADLNAAPGGKASHISQLMGSTGKVVAMDRTKSKISQVATTAIRLGCKNIHPTIQDTRYVDVDHPSLKPDRCLVDPPCTSLGVTPKLFDYTSELDVEHLAEYQRQFLRSASKILRRGKILVYSVCTVTWEECEEIAAYAEDECKLELVEQKPLIGDPGLTSHPHRNLLQRFHPHKHGIGYFIAKFAKR